MHDQYFSMYYTRLEVTCPEDFREILMAEIAEAGFDTLMETEAGFEAYVEEKNFDTAALDDIKNRYAESVGISYVTSRVEKQNWNEEWERNYEPIIVDDKCLIRASFHNIKAEFPYVITITPKMSFGTGHHQTTYLMVKSQMRIDHANKRVMDAGCGTAVLSIMACKLGATEVEAFDIDEWSMLNGKENVEINGCRQVKFQQGKIVEVALEGKFDIILANINKNVLLAEIQEYQKFLRPSGKLLMSGFYTHDIPDISKKCERYGLREVFRDEKETWAAILFQRD